jgi:hypothetical protein
MPERFAVSSGSRLVKTAPALFQLMPGAGYRRKTNKGTAHEGAFIFLSKLFRHHINSETVDLVRVARCTSRTASTGKSIKS